jgi:hypothetical protein
MNISSKKDKTKMKGGLNPLKLTKHTLSYDKIVGLCLGVRSGARGISYPIPLAGLAGFLLFEKNISF